MSQVRDKGRLTTRKVHEHDVTGLPPQDTPHESLHTSSVTRSTAPPLAFHSHPPVLHPLQEVQDAISVVYHLMSNHGAGMASTAGGAGGDDDGSGSGSGGHTVAFTARVMLKALQVTAACLAPHFPLPLSTPLVCVMMLKAPPVSPHTKRPICPHL